MRVLEYVQTTCALAIIGFMLFIFFFDVQDLHFMEGKQTTLRFQKSAEGGRPSNTCAAWSLDFPAIAPIRIATSAVRRVK